MFNLLKAGLFACLLLLPLVAADYHKSHPQAWKATNINDAAMALYGKEKFSTIKESNNIELITPKALVEDAQQIPVRIRIDTPAKSIAIMVDKHDRALIAVFDTEHFEKTDLSIHMGLERKATLFAVIETKNGELLYQRAHIDVVCLPCMAN